MDQHVRNIVCGCFYQLQQLQRVAWCTAVSETLTTLRPGLTIINAVRIVYSVLTQVIVVLNATAPLVVGAGKFDQYDHVTPFLRDVLCLCLIEYSSR